MLYIILSVSFVVHAAALYPPSSNVVSLHASNFDNLVIESDEVWIVEFFAPWCGHCQQLVPEYEKAATALKRIAKLGAVNVDNHKDLGERFDVKSFPTIKVFGIDKTRPEDYKGARTAEGFVNTALTTIRRKAYEKLGIGPEQNSGDVIELTDSNFDKLVLNSEHMWLVEFFAPWCGHCKNLAPQWSMAASKLKGKVKLGALDATVHTKKAADFGVRGYPTIKYFRPGKKDSNSAANYDGGRSADDIVNWALDKFSQNIPAPEVKQIIDNISFKEECEKKLLCVISILPYILDCQSKCRNDYLHLLKKLAEKYKAKMWGWIWSEATSQSELENTLEIGGFGYPTMAVLNTRKLKFSMFRGSFSEVGINEFLRDLSYGRGNTVELKGGKLPQIVNVIAWDGKDAELSQEDDIDLSDVVLDEKEEL